MTPPARLAFAAGPATGRHRPRPAGFLGLVFGGLSLICSFGAAPGQTASASPHSPDPPAHWAFQPPAAVVPCPNVHDRSWVRTPVDQFILARREALDLRPARVASRAQRLRRLKFDLLGLPPTPAEIDEFFADRAPDAWARWVDRFLASPHYGERWARHWLDVVRYAESDGFEHDAARPHSWRYRDYVVRALNDDKPYNRFIQEQVAGDELWPDDPDAVIATVFHLLGPDMVDSADQIQRRLLTLSDMTDITASAFLGLTLACARCHDHKSEPFTQADYYGFLAHYAPAQFHRDWPVPTPEQRARHAADPLTYQAAAGGLRTRLSTLEDPARAQVRNRKLAAMSEDVQLAHRTPRARRTPEQESSVLETTPHLQVTEAELSGALSPADRKLRQSWLAELRKLPPPLALPATLALQNSNGPDPVTHVLGRGDYQHPGPVATPAAPLVLRPRPSPGPTPAASGRRSLYIFAQRNLRFPFLEVFDAPDSNLSCPERGQSTTAPQSLKLLNSAGSWAARPAGPNFGPPASFSPSLAPALPPPAPHFAARARNVIFLFMSGGPSHVDLFDPKPALQRLAGQPIPDSFGTFKTRRNVARNKLMPAVRPFRPRGQSGLEISDFLPHLAQHADSLCLLRGCRSDSVTHPESVYLMNTGSILMGRPSLGAWATYGLGTENANLPAFVVLPDPNGWVKGGAPAWGNGYLPATFQGTLLRGGQVIGATDEVGLRAVTEIAHVHDVHATLLHLLGLDHERLVFRRNVP